MNTSRISLVRRNFMAKTSYYARLGLPATIFTETDALTAVDCGLPSDTFNVIIPTTTNIDELANQLSSHLQHFTDKQFPVAVWCWNDILTVELSQLLARHGLTNDESDVAMWLNLQTTPIVKPVPQSLLIRSVQTPDDYEQFADVITELFGDSAEADQIRLYHQNSSKVHTANQPMKLYIGIAEDKVVATGTLFLDGCLAGIYDIATRPDWRGWGFGSQMFHYLLWLAQQHSATQAVLQASTDGLGIYKRAGFTEVGLVQVFGNGPLA